MRALLAGCFCRRSLYLAKIEDKGERRIEEKLEVDALSGLNTGGCWTAMSNESITD